MQRKPSMPFPQKLIFTGMFGCVATAVLDVPWPIVTVFGFTQVLGLFVFAAFVFLIALGIVLGIVAASAAHKARRMKSSQTKSDDATAGPSESLVPAGEAVLPKV